MITDGEGGADGVELILTVADEEMAAATLESTVVALLAEHVEVQPISPEVGSVVGTLGVWSIVGVASPAGVVDAEWDVVTLPLGAGPVTFFGAAITVDAELINRNADSSAHGGMLLPIHVGYSLATLACIAADLSLEPSDGGLAAIDCIVEEGALQLSCRCQCMLDHQSRKAVCNTALKWALLGLGVLFAIGFFACMALCPMTVRSGSLHA